MLKGEENNIVVGKREIFGVRYRFISILYYLLTMTLEKLLNF